MSLFSERIRALREDGDLNQTDMAKILGTNQRKISRLETGECEPNIEDIKNYCLYFNISADFLLGLTNEPKKLKNSDKGLI